jgi:hypothetical protein
MKLKLIAIALLFSIQMGAQFFRGIGVYGALTQSAHYYRNKDHSLKDPMLFVPQYYYPTTHISKEGFNWGAGIFAEFLRYDRFRWQTEAEYVNKSVREKDYVDQYLGIANGGRSTNKNTYIQWNNYAKFYYPIFQYSHTYLMPGIRLEYLFNRSNTAFLPVSNDFPRFWFSGNVGLGYEFPLFKNFSGFGEFHWNPDILRHRHANTFVRNRTFEYRTGIMWRPRVRRIDDCNAPKYHGPNY